MPSQASAPDPSSSPSQSEGGPFVIRHPAGSERISPYCFLPGYRQPAPLGRGLAPGPCVAHTEGTWKVFSPLTPPNRAGITCSVALQHAKAFFTVFCLGTTPSPQIEKPQRANAMQESLLCCLLPGGVPPFFTGPLGPTGGRTPSLSRLSRQQDPQVAISTDSYGWSLTAFKGMDESCASEVGTAGIQISEEKRN